MYFFLQRLCWKMEDHPHSRTRCASSLPSARLYHITANKCNTFPLLSQVAYSSCVHALCPFIAPCLHSLLSSSSILAQRRPLYTPPPINTLCEVCCIIRLCAFLVPPIYTHTHTHKTLIDCISKTEWMKPSLLLIICFCVNSVMHISFGKEFSALVCTLCFHFVEESNTHRLKCHLLLIIIISGSLLLAWLSSSPFLHVWIANVCFLLLFFIISRIHI